MTSRSLRNDDIASKKLLELSGSHQFIGKVQTRRALAVKPPSPKDLDQGEVPLIHCDIDLYFFDDPDCIFFCTDHDSDNWRLYEHS